MGKKRIPPVLGRHWLGRRIPRLPPHSQQDMHSSPETDPENPTSAVVLALAGERIDMIAALPPSQCMVNPPVPVRCNSHGSGRGEVA